MKTGPPFYLRWLMQLHRLLYRASAGRIGSRLDGMPVLELYTVGRKTGETRTHLLTYLREGNAFIIAGSNWGQDRPPGWFFNIEAHPQARIQVRGRMIAVRARETEGTERDKLWRKFKVIGSNYAGYEQTAKRVIPVIALEPLETS